MLRQLILYTGLAALLSAQSVEAPKPTPNILSTPKQNEDRVAQGSAAFALELYQKVAPEIKGNLCLSPYSVISALDIPYVGAKGATQFQMQKVLHLQLPGGNAEEAIAGVNQQLFSKLSDTSEELRVLQANSLWVQTGMPLLPSFVDTVERFYRGLVKRVDFAHQLETARSEINNWTREKTFGKIPMIIPKGTLTTGTKMVIVNALYLKAKWENPFDTRITTRLPFFVNDDSTVSPLMMIATFSLPYYHEESFSAVELPYVTPHSTPVELALLVVLPNNIEAFENSLTLGKLTQIKEGLRTERIHITLPAFKFTTQLRLNDPLIGLGMSDAFSDTADFSGITGKKDLMISDVIQQTFFSVDEAGTEAAAATAITMTRTSMISGNPIEFKVDRPFSFVLYDKKTGVILFMGRVVNPV